MLRQIQCMVLWFEITVFIYNGSLSNSIAVDRDNHVGAEDGGENRGIGLKRCFRFDFAVVGDSFCEEV